MSSCVQGFHPKVSAHAGHTTKKETGGIPPASFKLIIERSQILQSTISMKKTVFRLIIS